MFRDFAAVVLDELAPRASGPGRDAAIDKKKGKAYNIHAAALEREENRVSRNSMVMVMVLYVSVLIGGVGTKPFIFIFFSLRLLVSLSLCFSGWLYGS